MTEKPQRPKQQSTDFQDDDSSGTDTSYGGLYAALLRNALNVFYLEYRTVLLEKLYSLQELLSMGREVLARLRPGLLGYHSRLEVLSEPWQSQDHEVSALEEEFLAIHLPMKQWRALPEILSNTLLLTAKSEMTRSMERVFECTQTLSTVQEQVVLQAQKVMDWISVQQESAEASMAQHYAQQFYAMQQLKARTLESLQHSDQKLTALEKDLQVLEQKIHQEHEVEPVLALHQEPSIRPSWASLIPRPTPKSFDFWEQ